MELIEDILLKTNQLSVGYTQKRKPLPILSGINLSLKRGELVCLMGQNGVGKSTLLRTLSGVQTPLEGYVELDGENIHQLSRIETAKRISLVLTERLNAGNLTVYEVVAMGRYPYIGLDIRLSNEDLDKLDEVIELVGIRTIVEKPIYQLSDGQLQKVMIARALAQNGEIIVLDEPTAHLDLNNRVSVIRLLKSLATTTGKLVLMATHELDLALQTADRLILVDQKGGLSEGIPEDLVLNGTLDKVFDLKGFDLKTGKYQHESGTLGDIQLIGDGYSYLWTKNALERVGFSVVDNGERSIEVMVGDNVIKWQYGKKYVTSIRDLIDLL